MTEKGNYIPALKFGFLTALFDPFLRIFIPEIKFKEAVIKQAEIKSIARVLDFGCGTGTMVILMKSKYPDTLITGIDIDRDILKIAANKVADRGLKIKLDHYQGSSLPYPDHYFDRVVSSLVFHHLTSDQKLAVLKEIRRVLKPGGTLHIGDLGKPRNFLMKAIAQFLKRFEPIEDNIQGLLPEFMEKSGFEAVTETQYFNTALGTLSIYKGDKLQ
ncbi:MAG TPA: class I SAM-dependent methyltransferase [Bacillota bacterium]|nr:class I SAM-dependent methyltransferase [Bacillota bacterium]